MSGIFDPIRDLIKSVADESRPLRPAVVEDTSRWSNAGAAFVSVRAGGQLLANTAYRDGREPLVGETLYIAKANAGHAGHVALPLPGPATTARQQICTDAIFYLVGKSATTGAFRILRYASLAGVGETWSDIAACPAGAVGGHEPRLFWAVVSDELGAPSHGFPDGVTSYAAAGLRYRFFCHARGGELFYSDDLCATWAGTGRSFAHVGDVPWFARMWACDAGSLYESVDNGATWAAIPGSAPPAGDWLFVGGPAAKGLSDRYGNVADFTPSGGTRALRAGNTEPNHAYRPSIRAVSTAGAWITINAFAHYAYPTDSADPPYSATDMGGSGRSLQRSWADGGSDQGDWTVTHRTLGIADRWGAPFVVAHQRRDRYGVYGGATDADHAFSASWPAIMVGADYCQIAADTFPDATAPYAEGTAKALPVVATFDYGSGATTSNEQSSSHTHFVIQQTSPLGGIGWFNDAPNAYYVNDYNHPAALTGLAIIDMAQCASGTYPAFNNCFLVALDDATEGGDHASFVLANSVTPAGGAPWGGSYSTAPYAGAVATMRADLGDYYVGTRGSICGYSPGIDTP